MEEKIQRDGADAVRIDLTIEEIKEADEVSPNVECEQSFADERSDDKKDPEANVSPCCTFFSGCSIKDLSSLIFIERY